MKKILFIIILSLIGNNVAYAQDDSIIQEKIEINSLDYKMYEMDAVLAENSADVYDLKAEEINLFYKIIRSKGTTRTSLLDLYEKLDLTIEKYLIPLEMDGAAHLLSMEAESRLNQLTLDAYTLMQDLYTLEILIPGYEKEVSILKEMKDLATLQLDTGEITLLVYEKSAFAYEEAYAKLRLSQISYDQLSLELENIFGSFSKELIVEVMDELQWQVDDLDRVDDYINKALIQRSDMAEAVLGLELLEKEMAIYEENRTYLYYEDRGLEYEVLVNDYAIAQVQLEALQLKIEEEIRFQYDLILKKSSLLDQYERKVSDAHTSLEKIEASYELGQISELTYIQERLAYESIILNQKNMEIDLVLEWMELEYMSETGLGR